MDGKSRNVKGLGRLDHNWANAMEEDHNWFAIQLENQIDLSVLFRHTEQGLGPLEGSFVGISSPDGASAVEKQFQLEPLDLWQSPRTQKKYPSGWKFSVPQKEMTLTILPVIKDQEGKLMGMSFWQGLCSVMGTVNGGTVKGIAFCMVQGYPK